MKSIHLKAKKGIKVVVILLSVLVVLAVLLFLLLWINSPGSIEPLVDTDGKDTL